HQTRRAWGSEDQQAHDRVAIEARKPFSGANRAAFNEALNRPRCCIGIRQHHVTRQYCVRFAESGFASIAAPTLNPALAEVTKSLAGLVLASEAGHGFSPLAFCGEKPQNQFGSRSWLTPRFGLAPTPVSAEAGALNQQLSNYGGLIAILGLLSVQPLSADTLRGSYLTPKSFLSLRRRNGCCPCRKWTPQFPPGLSSIFYRFLNTPRFRQSIRHCIDSSQGITVLGQTSTELAEFLANFLGSEWFGSQRDDLENVVRQAGLHDLL